MAAAPSGSTPMDTANVAPPFDTPPFVGTDGIAPLDMEKDAIQIIGEYLYVPSTAQTVPDAGTPGTPGYNPGIANKIAMRLTAIERKLMLLFGKNANDIATDMNSLMGQKLLAPMVQRI